MEKNWIVVEIDQYNDCNVDGFSGAIGPFTEEEAKERAKKLDAYNHYATSFRAVELKLTHWAEK